MKKSHIIFLVLLSFLMVIGIYKIQSNLSREDIKNISKKEEQKSDISKIEEFYNSKLTNNYSSILNIKEDYKLKDALDDNLLVIDNYTIYNSNLYDNFKDKIKRGEDAFLRVIITTVEGDILIDDIKVENRKIEVIFDNTRDRYLANDSRKIEIKEFSNLDLSGSISDLLTSL